MSTLKEAAGILQNNPIFQAMQTIVNHAGEVDQIDGQLSERTTQLKRADERLAATNKKIIAAEQALAETEEKSRKLVADANTNARITTESANSEATAKLKKAEQDRIVIASAARELQASNTKALEELKAAIRDRTAELKSLETRLSSAREAARHLIEG